MNQPNKAASINEIIARTSVMAFNSGFETGVKLAQDEIRTIVKEIKVADEIGEYCYLKDLEEYIAEANKLRGTTPGQTTAKVSAQNG